MQGKKEKQKNFVILELFNFSELYGQEVSYYGEGLIVTGEAMNQLGDMRYVTEKLENPLKVRGITIGNQDPGLALQSILDLGVSPNCSRNFGLSLDK